MAVGNGATRGGQMGMVWRRGRRYVDLEVLGFKGWGW